MSLFQCENCGSVENTALSAQGFAPMRHLFDWSYNMGLEGMRLCSACGPTTYRDGSPTKYGVWHKVFPRTYLPVGLFVTNQRGNLAHKDTGDEDYRPFIIRQDGNFVNRGLL